MIRKRQSVDKVRASRDGHEYHEAWAAREAMKLVLPADDFVGMAVEGLEPADQKKASSESAEIADLTLYYGSYCSFRRARRIVITQFKYSVASETIPFRASSAKKTIQKFALSYLDHINNFGKQAVSNKLKFELITNRPIYSNLIKAIEGIKLGSSLTGDIKKQADQFISASGLTGKELLKFTKKLTITGSTGGLASQKKKLSTIITDWSPAPDAMARVRLGEMRQLVRNKAGFAGDRDNLIRRTDVLDALDVQTPDALFPCQESFPEVGTIVSRDQLKQALKNIPKLDKTLVIHAAGGIGKTVFMQSLFKGLSENHKTILFDCFGGGSYRAPEDARHLPKNGLIHIVNTLAREGLCDLLLPSNENVEELIKAFKARLRKGVETLRRTRPNAQILLFFDAIDNAAEHAKDLGEKAFPTLLIESFHHGEHIPGVQLIVSCRSHRREVSKKDIACQELELLPFTVEETREYLEDRIDGVTDTQIRVAFARSDGNPRILEHLVKSDRGLLDLSEIDNKIELNDLIRARIDEALTDARKRGYKETQIQSFLAGLSVLPPPVPINEYADAHGIEHSIVEGFSADLAPLLERTKHGLMFRDEPTETFIKEEYAINDGTLNILATNLLKKQESSVYAANSLPRLLQIMGDDKRLFELAFDERFPNEITSAIGKQSIRYSRIKAAVRQAVRTKNYDHLIHLLVELSTLSATDQRGSDYILENPDLVIASRDIDSTRRLFEIRNCWAGTRHARLAIASILSGDSNDAYRHISSTVEWVDHYFRQDNDHHRDNAGPERLDIAAVPLCFILQKRPKEAARYMSHWKDWYAFEVSEHLFSLLHQAQLENVISQSDFTNFLQYLRKKPGVLAGALSFSEFKDDIKIDLLEMLVKSFNKKELEVSTDRHKEASCFQDGLINATAIAARLKRYDLAKKISNIWQPEIPQVWSYTDRHSNYGCFRYITYKLLQSIANKKPFAPKIILPAELSHFTSSIKNNLSIADFRKALKRKLDKQFNSEKGVEDEKRNLSYERKREIEGFIDDKLEMLTEISALVFEILSAEQDHANRSFTKLISIWNKTREKLQGSAYYRDKNMFYHQFIKEAVSFCFWARNDLKAASVRKYISELSNTNYISSSYLIKITSILNQRQKLHSCSDEIANITKLSIEREDDVIHRASLFAELARAILPFSQEEAAIYFQLGLEQMDTIGSGDHQFTNELLIFASKIQGNEISDEDIHTLSNICELNMSYEEEKFPWASFAYGFSNISGLRGLAKIARWDDREKISLNYTLLPYLTALIEHEKITPSVALSLLQLSSPAELYSCGTEQLANVIENKSFSDIKDLTQELIRQFERNHSGIFMSSTIQKLGELYGHAFGKDTKEYKRLNKMVRHYHKAIDESNANSNFRPHEKLYKRRNETKEKERAQAALNRIVRKTDPSNWDSLSIAMDDLDKIRYIYDYKKGFFNRLRKKLSLQKRTTYIRNISKLENIGIYTKLDELQECKIAWVKNSQAVKRALKEIPIPIIQIHYDEFISHDYFSKSKLEELSQITDTPSSSLILEFISIYADPDIHIPASIWMALTSFICQDVSDGEGQIALSRLLNSNAAKLSSTVVDGPWNTVCYPQGSEDDIAAGLIWRMLGSPYAADRWRAAHSLRCLGKFGLWQIIDKVFSHYTSESVHPFQAPELAFYFLHARLWFLIAIARIAVDHPDELAKNKKKLLGIALNDDFPHVLIRHFTSQALLTCYNQGAITLSKGNITDLEAINQSPFPISTVESYYNDSFYKSRPDSIPAVEPEFSLDYDFDKTDVQHLCRVFNISRWHVKDAITTWVRQFDAETTRMYDSGNRENHETRRSTGISPRYHSYGQQLGWHGLYLSAGQILAKHPVIKRSYDSDDYNQWKDWLSDEVLTRKDGLWLSDGLDKPPLDTQVNLLKQGKKSLEVTGDREQLLGLLGIKTKLGSEITVKGGWTSDDNVDVIISSALAEHTKSRTLARQLSKEDPFQAWLPASEGYEDEEDERCLSDKPGFTPWSVWTSGEPRLDQTDPLSADCVARRLRLTQSINRINSLQPADPFNKYWTNPRGKIALDSQAWGRNSRRDDGSENGSRLICKSSFLKKVLKKMDKDLVILLILRRYESGYGSKRSQYWHTMATIRITQSLDYEFFPGIVNKLHVSEF